jgi:hypothetical protein
MKAFRSHVNPEKVIFQLGEAFATSFVAGGKIIEIDSAVELEMFITAS